MKSTDTILRELTPDEIISRQPFSHFGWEGVGAFSFLTISEGYWNCAKIIFEQMKENPNDFALVDSLIYPLFFNFRHSIETYLKLLFLSLGNKQKLRGVISLRKVIIFNPYGPLFALF